MIILQGAKPTEAKSEAGSYTTNNNVMPFSKRTYSFREGKLADDDGQNTPLRKIKSRGRTFIGAKTPSIENTQEAAFGLLSPFTRGSVRLKSIRKRKMAESKHDGTSFKREKITDKEKDEIEIKIEDNIKMRDGVSKLLAGCHDARQAMDIGKNLLTINSRMLSLMSSLQKKRSSNILKDYKKGNSSREKGFEPCVGDLAVSDIRIPLLWKQDAHFRMKAGEQPTLLYHMFCLLKINDQVFDTPLFQFSQIDTDVTFNDVFTFRNIQPDFKLEVEVYYSVIQNPDNPAWTPIRTPKKSFYSSAPQFCLAAHAQLTVDNVQDGFVVSDFTMGGIGASATAVVGHVDDLPDNPLALWGQFSCQLRARPSCFLSENLEGHLLMQSSSDGQPVWEKYFCRLRECTVQCWKTNPEKEESFSMSPGITIKLRKDMKLNVETNADKFGRCIIILTSKDSEKKEPVLAFENEEDFEMWRKSLQKTILNIKAWKASNYTFMDIEEFEAKKLALKKTMNYFDQHLSNNDNKEDASILAKKAGKSSSKSSFYLPEITPKIRSFYDQINIEDAVDSTVRTTVSDDLSKEKDVSDSLSKENESELEYKEEKKTEVMPEESTSNESLQTNGKDQLSIVQSRESHPTTDEEKISDDHEEYNLIRASSVISNDQKESEGGTEASVSIDVSSKIVEDSVPIVCLNNEAALEEDKVADSQSQDVRTKDTTLSEDRTECQSDIAELSKDTPENTEEAVESTKDLTSNGLVEGNYALNVDDEAIETEESVLDYFMEAIDSAAQLDEYGDIDLTQESSQESASIDTENDAQPNPNGYETFEGNDPVGTAEQRDNLEFSDNVIEGTDDVIPNENTTENEQDCTDQINEGNGVEDSSKLEETSICEDSNVEPAAAVEENSNQNAEIESNDLTRDTKETVAEDSTASVDEKVASPEEPTSTKDEGSEELAESFSNGEVADKELFEGEEFLGADKEGIEIGNQSELIGDESSNVSGPNNINVVPDNCTDETVATEGITKAANRDEKMETDV